MLYVDLAEVPEIFDRAPLWSARRRALAQFKRADYLGPADISLDAAVRSAVHAKLGREPRGPIRLLTHGRYFGYCFNPVSFYYCFDEADQRVEAVVAEITNTPWQERHTYVLDAASVGAVASRFDKKFHVSPFMPMDMEYAWRFSEPADDLAVHMQNFRSGDLIFDATLHLKASPMTARGLLQILLEFPFMTLRVIAAIHWQALRLWLKGLRVHDHPAKGIEPAPNP